MPLVELGSSEALDTMKSNASSTWPQRGGENRLSPFAKPRIKPKFHLEPGEKIFTIGSCFARNVERELAARGFDLPALEVIKSDEDFRIAGTAVLNNYGTPSIYNEIHWALERDYEQEECFYPMGEKWVDMHLHNRLRPATLDIVENRRNAMIAAYREIRNCRVVIITLGLAEVWFDRKTETYLNQPPRRSMIREAPDRFALHVLSFEEAAGYMRKSMQLIQKHGRDDIKVLLTVSPVPLTATHRDMDVMEANAYSKSVLRTVAEHVRAEFDFVDYYPSFESVTLSERSVAWEDDEVHVTKDIVAMNIGRMVKAYADGELTVDDVRDRARTAQPAAIFAMVRDNPDLLEEPDIREIFVKAALATGNLSAAEEYIAEDDELSHAQLAWAKNDPEKVLNLQNVVPKSGFERSLYFSLKLKALMSLDRKGEAERVINDWVSLVPKAYEPYRLMAELSSDDAESLSLYERAVEVSENEPRVVLEYAERMLQAGNREKAREVAQQINVTHSQIRRRVDAILATI